jgi:hypothetical protein
MIMNSGRRFVQESTDAVETDTIVTGEAEAAQKAMIDRKATASGWRGDARLEASKGRLRGLKGGDPVPPDNEPAENSARINAETLARRARGKELPDHPPAEGEVDASAARKAMDQRKADAWKKRPSRVDRAHGDRAAGGAR